MHRVFSSFGTSLLCSRQARRNAARSLSPAFKRISFCFKPSGRHSFRVDAGLPKCGSITPHFSNVTDTLKRALASAKEIVRTAAAKISGKAVSALPRSPRGGVGARDGTASLVTCSGLVAGVARALLYHGLRMGLFPSMKRSLGLSQTNVLGKMVAGAACGAVGSVICNPLDLVA